MNMFLSILVILVVYFLIVEVVYYFFSFNYRYEFMTIFSLDEIDEGAGFIFALFWPVTILFFCIFNTFITFLLFS